MSEIVGFVGMSHAPYATMTPPASADAPGGAFMADAARVARAVAELAPDVVVTIGPDHFHGNFYDMMPPFALGVVGNASVSISRTGTLYLAMSAWQAAMIEGSTS